jgi:exodeoxyribonuclease VII large subunit
VQHYLRHYKDELVHFYQVVINNSRNMLFDHKSRLMHIGNAMIMKPRKMVDGRKMELLHTISMLKSFQLSYLKNQKGYLNHFVTFFRMASPVNIMKRGFALIKVNGKIVSDADNIEQGKPVTIILKESEIESIVTSKKGYNGKDFDI